MPDCRSLGCGDRACEPWHAGSGGAALGALPLPSPPPPLSHAAPGSVFRKKNLRQLALALLSGWCVTSLVYCWDTRLPRPRLTKDGEPAPAGKAPRSGADEVAAPAAAGGKPAASNGSFLQHRKGST